MPDKTPPAVEAARLQAQAAKWVAVWTFAGVVLAALVALGTPFIAELAKKIFATPTLITPTVESPPGATPTPTETGGDCISSETWTAHHGETHRIKSGCWRLEDWGIRAQDGGISLSVVSTPDYQWHGIYAPLPPDSDIQFKIHVDELQTILAHDANIALGVVNTDLPAGRLLFYHVTGSNSPIGITLAEWGLKNGCWIQSYAKNTDQQVKFSIRGSILDVFLDGEQVACPIDLRSMGDSPKVFWVGYALSAEASLSALVSDFSITQR